MRNTSLLYLVLSLLLFSTIIVTTQWYLGKRTLRWVGRLDLPDKKKRLLKGLTICALVFLNMPLVYTFIAGVPKNPVPPLIMYPIVYPYAIWGSSYVFILIILKLKDLISFALRKTKTLAGRSSSQPAENEIYTDPSRRNFLSIAGKSIVAAPVALSCYGVFIGKQNYITREVNINIPGLPMELQRLKIVQISDIHCGIFMGEAEIRKWINILESLKPDILLVTGDFVGTSNDSVEYCAAGLKYLRSMMPIYACLGNHDYYGNEKDLIGAISNSGVNILRNSSDTIAFKGADLNICGVEDMMNSDPDLAIAVKKIDDTKATILMSHNPNYFKEAKKHGIDLTISGHTHGGQVDINLAGLYLSPAQLITKYVKGHFIENGCNLYVNAGIGTIGFPLRLNVPPEITVFKLI
ncbi:MAG: metallophosphoesterase [Candidatus Schekmanbacteria bacterium]|nr:metallophosphoesterase [Candidatus Schekmanbacteria bacterium]